VLPRTTAEAAPTENTPLRPPIVRQLSRQQQSRREQTRGQTQDEVAQQLSEEIIGFMQRNWCYVLVAFLILIALWIVTTVFLILAVIAVCENFDGKCDQPLKYYLIVSLLWGQIPQRLHATLSNHFETIANRPITSTLVFSALGWVPIIWGVYMVLASKTCHSTNPGLYYPTARYIIFQVVFFLVLLVYAVAASIGLRSAMLLFARLIAAPGCEAAVHEFPKIKAGDPELVSPEDGEVLACPICMEELKGAVRTPCSHYFHEACLATWCANHLTCPMCRERLAEPDPEKA